MPVQERTFGFLRRRPLLAATLALLAAACSGDPGSSGPRAQGQTEFSSTSPQGVRGPGFGLEGAADNAASAPPTNSGSRSADTQRKVEETDLYRLEGDRLYYLNAYRGLMVFDVSNVDQPRFLGRSPVYGYPHEMIVRNGVATVVLSDWYGKMDDGTPFHGSIVRGIDATDPANMKVLGEAPLGGQVRDTRVVGDVLYAVTEEYPYYYGWLDDARTSSSSQPKVGVSSVSFAGGKIEKKSHYQSVGSGGVFYVTRDAIMLGHPVYGAPDANGYAQPTGDTALDYIDISDPAGSIVRRGSVTFNGYIQGWGTDNGRWNIDFADQKTAHALACSGNYYCGSGQPLVLATADFTNPDQPSMVSRVTIPANAWSPAVRFDGNRMYLSPSDGYIYTNSGVESGTTPIQIFDLSNPAAPTLKGTVNVAGQIWNFTPAGNRLFALGNSYSSKNNSYGSQVDLHYLDVTDAAAPNALGKASFGEGWAWTPAAGTFKAFTKNDAEGLVVLPFSGYDYNSYQYNNGVQLIEFTPNTIQTSGAAHTKGWVERGIFVKNRLVSLSNLALAVIDYTNRASPTVVTELTLARNVVNARAQGNGTVAELSSDFWDNDVSKSELRVLDAARVEETNSDATLAKLDIPGTNARVFHNGNLSYAVTQVVRRGACVDSAGNPIPGRGDGSECEFWHTRVQVIDRSGAQPKLRGAIDLPETYGYNHWGWGWGYWGCFAWDWYYGSQAVQAGNVLAFQTYEPNADWSQVTQALVTVNLSNPDQPVMGRTNIVNNSRWWWGNLRAFGDRLYATHYEYVTEPFYDSANNVWNPGTVRYFLDRIDLSDPKQPVVGARINVPGFLVGASETNPNLIYTIDYRWYGNHSGNELAVSLLEGNLAYYQGGVSIPGYVGDVFVRGDRAYFTVQEYIENPNGSSTSRNQLYQADLSDPAHPSLATSTPSEGWGWMLDVQGDRAFVQSGWNDAGLDIYKLNASEPPTFEQTVRVRGWYAGSLSREGSDVYLSTGYWGTEHIKLK
ncbi:MAG: beta-propeller domain-containing protein [Myxococcota bacterium]